MWHVSPQFLEDDEEPLSRRKKGKSRGGATSKIAKAKTKNDFLALLGDLLQAHGRASGIDRGKLYEVSSGVLS